MKLNKSLLYYLILFLLLIEAKEIAAQNIPYKCEIKNINPIDSKNFTFEIWFENTGINPLQLYGFQAGISFNYSGLANGGIISVSFVPGSGIAAPSVLLDPYSKQIRLIAIPFPNINSAPVIPTIGGIRYAKIKVTNTLAFSPVQPNFSWSYVASSSTVTQTALFCYINGTGFGSNISNPSNQFISSNPVINANMVPTLSEWGLIILAILLLFSGMVFIKRE
jgi:hypothetical protein